LSVTEPPRIAGPVAHPKAPRIAPPPGAWDTHAHIFGPSDKFPYTAARGYTPPDAPVENYIALLDRLGLARGVVVQGNAHGYDNHVLLDALARYPQLLCGVAITDTRIKPGILRDWHKLGMRGLRFHLFSDAGRPDYVRGVGLDVFEVFRKTMAELGWVMQVFCDWRLMQDVAPALRDISRDMPVIIDHMLHIPAARGTGDANFQALLRLVGEGAVHVKLSAPYRMSAQFHDYADVHPFHAALHAANPERMLWGTDWPHPSTEAAVMPDDGHLLDLFCAWTPDEAMRRRILVETPARLFGG
jgi:predicted TIM-barrel fold metal-dependent hydrolase